MFTPDIERMQSALWTRTQAGEQYMLASKSTYSPESQRLRDIGEKLETASRLIMEAHAAIETARIETEVSVRVLAMESIRRVDNAETP